MKKGVLILLLLFSLASANSVQALGTPEVTFIPANFSADTGFIVIVDPQSTASTRVTWYLEGVLWEYEERQTWEIGLIPKVDDKFICYFSNKDYKSNCGPSPFKEPSKDFGPYYLILEAIDQYGSLTNKSLEVNTGAIQFEITKDIQLETLFLIVAASGALPEEVWFQIYDMDAEPFTEEQLLVFDPTTDRFRGNVTLEVGEYYLALWGHSVSPPDYGGTIERIMIGKPVAPGLPGIPGVAVADSVTMEILIGAGAEHEQKGFTLVNTGEATLSNLSVKVPDHLEPYLDISLDVDLLDENDSTFFTVTISDVQEGLQVKSAADIYSGTTLVGGIPLDLSVSVLGVAAPVVPIGGPGAFTISPSSWTGDYEMDAEISQDFTITNTADDDLTGISYTATGDLAGMVDATVPSTIAEGASAIISAQITPFSGGTYAGTIQIDSDMGSQSITVSIKVYEDITSDVESTRSDLEAAIGQMSPEQSTLLADVTDEISSDLDDAQSDWEFGSYSRAQRGYQEAAAKVALLESLVAAGFVPPTPAVPLPGEVAPTAPVAPPADNTMIIIILVVVLVGLVGFALWYYFTKMKGAPGAGEEKEEKELEEEF